LLGNTIGANFFLVGYALQKGGIPVSAQAIERAIELNGQAVEFNKRALALGRLAAHDPEAVENLVAAQESAVARIPLSQSLDALVKRRVDYLTDYQDAAYARRYSDRVARVRDAEATKCKGLSGLADAVARYYFKLLAYKDEYEVARLYSNGDFMKKIEATFEGDYTLRFHLAPPMLTRPDPKTGAISKREYGPSMMKAFAILAKLKGLRGGPFDVFGRSADRILERQLITEYEARLDELLQRLNADNHAVAVELASLPEHIRGYGSVRERHVEQVRPREKELLAKLRGASAGEAAA
jgi:indolepyruvate ferredoxin oxidoreductase